MPAIDTSRPWGAEIHRYQGHRHAVTLVTGDQRRTFYMRRARRAWPARYGPVAPFRGRAIASLLTLCTLTGGFNDSRVGAGLDLSCGKRRYEG